MKAFISAIWTIKGLSIGLPLISYIFDIDDGSNALAPNPYTVSVGNATTSPLRIKFDAFRIIK
jgi:hypothetical protein